MGLLARMPSTAIACSVIFVAVADFAGHRRDRTGASRRGWTLRIGAVGGKVIAAVTLSLVFLLMLSLGVERYVPG